MLGGISAFALSYMMRVPFTDENLKSTLLSLLLDRNGTSAFPLDR